MATGKKKGGSTSISVTFTAGISEADKERAKKAINKIKGASVKAWKAKPISGTAKKVASTVKGDLAKGRERRDTKLETTKKKSSASARAASVSTKATAARDKSKKQAATRSRIAARKRKQSGAGGG